MKWAMKHGMGISRSASVWLIRTRIDEEAEFHFFDVSEVLVRAREIGAKTIHVQGGDFATILRDDGERIDTVQTLLRHYGLAGTDPALDLWGEIVRDAEGPVKKGQPAHPEAFGVYALVQGYKAALVSDSDRLEQMPEMFHMLYEWCRKVVAGDIVPPRLSPVRSSTGVQPSGTL